MKIRAKANGNVIDMDDAGAKILIDAGIYEAVETKVQPLTTKDMPAKTKKVK